MEGGNQCCWNVGPTLVIFGHYFLAPQSWRCGFKADEMNLEIATSIPRNWQPQVGVEVCVFISGSVDGHLCLQEDEKDAIHRLSLRQLLFSEKESNE